jgi:hypothetical protein
MSRTRRRLWSFAIVASLPLCTDISAEDLDSGVAATVFTPQACLEIDPRTFPDVPFDQPFCAWIEQLAADQITTGCGNGNYGPNDPVTRGQIAALLEKAMRGTAVWYNRPSVFSCGCLPTGALGQSTCMSLSMTRLPVTAVSSPIACPHLGASSPDGATYGLDHTDERHRLHTVETGHILVLSRRRTANMLFP